MVGRQERRRDRRDPVDVEQVAPQLGDRRRLGRDRLDHDHLARRHALVPVHPVAVDRVSGGRAVDLEQREPLRAAPPRRSDGSGRTRSSHQSRERRNMPGARARGLPTAAGTSRAPRPARRAASSRRLARRDEVDVLLRDVHLARERGAAVAEAAVDRLLRRPERRDRLAALVRVVEVRAHHRAQHASPAVRRRDADDRRAGAGQHAARHRQRNGNAPAPPTISSALPGGEHPLERQHAREPLRLSGSGSLPKYWPIASVARRTRRDRRRGAPRSSSGDLLQRRVVEHQPPLAAVLEAHGDDAAGVDPGHDPFAERLVAHRVAGRERGMVAQRVLDRASCGRSPSAPG